MGQQDHIKNILVIMENKDVYYVTEENAKTIEGYMAAANPIYTFRDMKSGSLITIKIPKVSSIVRGADRV